MSAFNARLRPKEIFGMPMAAAIGLAFALVFAVLSMLVPVFLKFITVPIMVSGLVVSALAFFYGEELQWLPVMWLGRVVEPNRLASEVFGKEK